MRDIGRWMQKQRFQKSKRQQSSLRKCSFGDEMEIEAVSADDGSSSLEDCNSHSHSHF
jgi:hypothetical protein